MIILFCFLTQFTFAQDFVAVPGQPDPLVLKQEGQLLSVRITIGEPIKIFVVGREEAQLDLSQLSLTVRRMNPYPAKMLKVNKFGDYYTVSEPMNVDGMTDLEISTKIKSKQENFRFKINQKLH